VLPKRALCFIKYILENPHPIYNSKRINIEMKKNSGPINLTVEIDPVTHEYMILLPEYLVNDMGWYDGTCLSASLDGNDLVIETCETID
jgi:hypothetical protein